MRKTILITGLFMVLGLFGSNQANAQNGALVFTEADGCFWLFNGVDYLCAEDFTIVLTPSGNTLCHVTWQFPEGFADDLIPERGVSTYTFDGNVFGQYVVDESFQVFHNGKAKGVLHVNGSGYITP